jgi:hypothetical protein
MARALRNEIPRFILQGALKGAYLMFSCRISILGSFESQWTKDALQYAPWLGHAKADTLGFEPTLPLEAREVQTNHINTHVCSFMSQGTVNLNMYESGKKGRFSSFGRRISATFPRVAHSQPDTLRRVQSTCPCGSRDEPLLQSCMHAILLRARSRLYLTCRSLIVFQLDRTR